MFLGTLNYIRPHCGPAFGRVMTPLRELLRPTGKFPPNAAQLAAIEGLKDLVNEMHLLYVPDEAAAIEAAQAWCAGLPPAGRGYEMGADTSKIAMGGVMGQCAENNGKSLVLMYWNAPLSPAQSHWHPMEEELWGLVQLKRSVVKHFGRIPIIIHADHANLTRFEYLPLERIDAKHYKWHAELLLGGRLLLYRPGTGTLHRLPDALCGNPTSRNTPEPRAH